MAALMAACSCGVQAGLEGAVGSAVGDGEGEIEVVLGRPASGEPWQAVSAVRAQSVAAAVTSGRRVMRWDSDLCAVGVRVSYGGCSSGGVIHRLQEVASGVCAGPRRGVREDLGMSPIGRRRGWGSARVGEKKAVVAPEPHPSGARPPGVPRELVPRHVAIVMDGNGRWAKQRGLPRTEGHKAGEASLLDVIKGGIEIGVKYISAYAFSTENWARSPEEVRFLMGFNREVIHRRRDELDAMGVRVVWSGRRPRLWKTVIDELENAQERTKDNDTITLQFCVNYGGRAEIADAMKSIARDVAAGKLKPDRITEQTIARHLYAPDIPEVDLFVRSSGEQRTSNFLVWQLAYAEMVFLDTLWPDFDRRDLWRAIELYAQRDRRYGGAIPNEVSQ